MILVGSCLLVHVIYSLADFNSEVQFRLVELSRPIFLWNGRISQKMTQWSFYLDAEDYQGKLDSTNSHLSSPQPAISFAIFFAFITAPWTQSHLCTSLPCWLCNAIAWELGDWFDRFTSYQHSIGYARCPCYEYGIDYLWIILVKEMTSDM